MPVKRPVDKDSHVYLIDASGYIFRAYHALPPLTRKSDNLPVGAVAGFCNMLWKLLEDLKAGERPTHFACIFDKSSKSFRNDLYTEYKANRPPPPEDLVPQFPLVRDAAIAFGTPALEMENFEADDLIATYARQAEAKGARVSIVSSDKDLMQLVSDQICLRDTMKDKLICAPEVMEKFGVSPDKVVDVRRSAATASTTCPGARHRHQDRRPPQRVRRPRHASGTRLRDQAEQAPREPDRVRRSGAHLPHRSRSPLTPTCRASWKSSASPSRRPSPCSPSST